MTVGRRDTLRPRSAAADLAEQMRSGGPREGGCVIVVASPGTASTVRELHALHESGLAAVRVDGRRDLLTAVEQRRPDLVLLDVAVCPTTAPDVITELAHTGGPAVIVYGSLPDPATRAALLFAGADDCVLAPYLLDELVARVLAVLRRTHAGTRTSRGYGSLVAGSMRVDVDHHSVSIDGQHIALTVLEFRLLTWLLRHRGVAMPREQLLAEVWGYTIGTAETVTVHIRRLRAKIERDPSQPVWIETVRGVGYRFRSEPSELTTAAMR